MELEKAIEHLKEYIEIDTIYQNYKNTPNAYKSDFDEFCINHCESIEVVLNLIDKYKESSEFNWEQYQDIGKMYFDLREKIQDKIKELEDKWIDSADNETEENLNMCIDFCEDILEELLESE